MAATAVQQIIHNGPRNLVLKYTVGGTTGDTTAGVLVDVSALDSNIGVNGLTLMSASWSLFGLNVLLDWDATANVSLFELSEGEGDHDLTKYGGIKNNAGSGATGDVLWTTTGYTAAGDGGHIILSFKKT